MHQKSAKKNWSNLTPSSGQNCLNLSNRDIFRKFISLAIHWRIKLN